MTDHIHLGWVLLDTVDQQDVAQEGHFATGKQTLQTLGVKLVMMQRLEDHVHMATVLLTGGAPHHNVVHVH